MSLTADSLKRLEMLDAAKEAWGKAYKDYDRDRFEKIHKEMEAVRLKERAEEEMIEKMERLERLGKAMDQDNELRAAKEKIEANIKSHADSRIVYPSYYGGRSDPYEAIKVIEAWELNFNLGQVLKYIKRAGSKLGNSKTDDLRKAAWYLDREIQRDDGTLPLPFQAGHADDIRVSRKDQDPALGGLTNEKY